jgi:hypothetical protein
MIRSELLHEECELDRNDLIAALYEAAETLKYIDAATIKLGSRHLFNIDLLNNQFSVDYLLEKYNDQYPR